MSTNTSLLFSFSFLLFIALLHASTRANSDRKLHIVYMGALTEGQISPASQHTSMLQQVLQNMPVENVLVRSYTRSFSGFVANITEKERQQLSNMEGVVSVFSSKTIQLQTTRSWDFMGLIESTAKRNKTVESDIIIGVIDSGVWPESNSFSDEGFGPPPNKWKGACNGGKNFTCNNKIIGARYYNIVHPIQSGRDYYGHGSHTASIAAGNCVPNASFRGIANGTAKGGVPSARIAVYNVCMMGQCGIPDILAAFDDAIADGVDLITVSIGHASQDKFEEDIIAIGSFHAMANGILTAQAAGNGGSNLSTVGSVAPWLFTVGASTIDRLIVDKVGLGNGKNVTGKSMNPFSLGGKKPLVLDQDVIKNNCHLDYCWCLDKEKTDGKIVLCQNYAGIVNRYGVVGVITRFRKQDYPYGYPYEITISPSTAVDPQEFDVIRSFINSTKNPEAQILRSESAVDPTAPVVGDFSSRGPNLIVPYIIKPDITAPGVAILAAFSPQGKYAPDYYIKSGTSMATPHAIGVAAYVKTFHPDWSPSAIKSAIMTTALVMDPTKSKGAEFAYGSGHVNPIKAINPGLVYQIEKSDYMKMLCSDGISDDILRRISGDNSSTCPPNSDKTSWKDLNYPSMSAYFQSKKQFNITFNRTVTNVGHPESIYKAKIAEAKNVSVKVEPGVLSFRDINEKKSFTVTVSGYIESSILSSSLTWFDGDHSVRSPIVVYSTRGD